MTNQVPQSTAAITTEWLTDVLRASGTIGAGASVSELHLDPGAAGVGFLGEVGKIDLTYAGDAGGAPTSMMAKFPTQSPEIAAMMRPTRIFEREHRFYGEIAHQTPLRTPEIYHITCDTSDDDNEPEYYALLMEDLGGLTLGDQLEGVTPEQAMTALKALASHHAHFWNARGIENVEFIPPVNSAGNQAGQEIYRVSLPGFQEVFGDVLRDEMTPVAEAYTAANPKLLDAMAAMPHTLLHYDFRADNLFFDGDDSVAVIDWQAISRGGGACDVGYFLGQNLATEDRRAHEQDLLHGYFDELAKHGVTGYEFDTFVDDYRLGIMYGWIIPVFAVGSLDTSSERAMSLWSTVIDRLQDAIFDHNAQEFVL